MSQIIDEIMRILHKCHPNKDDFEIKTKDSSDFFESRKKNESDECFAGTRYNYIASIEYASLHKMLALYNFEVIETNLNYMGD